MSTTRRTAADLARDSRAAIGDVVAQSLVTRGWDALQERDGDGHARGALPYTDEALRLFEAAHRAQPDDDRVVHHLAIARHARAWDLELAGDPRAGDEWERALGHWRHVASSGSFWEALRGKLAAIDPGADPGITVAARRDLLVHLLEIHVDFVRHYTEAGTPDRAALHIEIVRRASIPPAAKKLLIARVFEALTAGVGEARTGGAFDSALTTVERFLALFEDYLPALRLHAEIANDWIRGLSYERWNDLLQVAQRAEPFARRLAAHPALSDDALAAAALHELAAQIALKGRDRGSSFMPKHEDAPVRIADREAGRAGFDLGLQWGRLAWLSSPSESHVRMMFGVCAEGYAISLHHEAVETLNAREVDRRARARAALSLYRRALALIQEAQRAEPDEESHRQSRQAVQGLIEQLEGVL